MRNYYFTFGTLKSHPFHGGWIIVKARSLEKAKSIFNLFFSDETDTQTCNCAFIYTEKEFMNTQMYENGNFGRRCHGIISFKAFKNKEGVNDEKYT